MLSITEIEQQWAALTDALTREEFDQLYDAALKAKAFDPVEILFFAKGWLA